MAIMMLLSFSGCEKINNLTKDVITTLEPTNVTWDDVFMQGWVDLSLMKGYYWASALSSARYAACCYTFENGKEPEVTYEERYRGFTVRAVTE